MVAPLKPCLPISKSRQKCQPLSAAGTGLPCQRGEGDKKRPPIMDCLPVLHSERCALKMNWLGQTGMAGGTRWKFIMLSRRQQPSIVDSFTVYCMAKAASWVVVAVAAVEAYRCWLWHFMELFNLVPPAPCQRQAARISRTVRYCSLHVCGRNRD